MRSVKLTLVSLLFLGLATVACQRAEDEELADTAALVDDDVEGRADDDGALKDGLAPASEQPDVVVRDAAEPTKQVVVVREEAPVRSQPRTTRRQPVQPVRTDDDVPARPVRREPVRPARVTIPAGTNFFVTTETALSTKSNQVGDPVAARTAENINVNGQVVIPAGALVEGHVSSMQSAGNPGEVSYLDLTFDRVRLANGEWLPISAVLAGKAGEEVRGSANIPRNVAIGAGAGAVLGQVIGGDTKSTVIGAVIGAGAGAAAGQATRDTYVIVPSGSRINIQLTSPVGVPLG